MPRRTKGEIPLLIQVAAAARTSATVKILHIKTRDSSSWARALVQISLHTFAALGITISIGVSVLGAAWVLMAGAVRKFFTTSMLMWIAPLAILYCFNHNMIPGLNNMSPYSQTILSGMLAVISVNVVIAFYIYMAMKEPSDKHEPDPAFLAEAKASIKQSIAPVESEDSSQSREKRE